MKKLDYIPENYNRIKVVGSLTELFNEPFGEANAVLFPRRLTGDFNATAEALFKRGKSFLYEARFPKELAAEGRQIRNDIEQIERVFRSLRVLRKVDLRVHGYKESEEGKNITKFHIDGAYNTAFGRLLCNYNEPVTEWIRNEDAVYDGCRDYEAVEDAPVFSFRPGDIWRQKSKGTGSTIRSDGNFFIHRSPAAVKNRTAETPKRLVLIAG